MVAARGRGGVRGPDARTAADAARDVRDEWCPQASARDHHLGAGSGGCTAVVGPRNAPRPPARGGWRGADDRVACRARAVGGRASDRVQDRPDAPRPALVDPRALPGAACARDRRSGCPDLFLPGLRSRRGFGPSPRRTVDVAGSTLEAASRRRGTFATKVNRAGGELRLRPGGPAAPAPVCPDGLRIGRPDLPASTAGRGPRPLRVPSSGGARCGCSAP